MQGQCNGPVPAGFPAQNVKLLPGQCVLRMPSPDEHYLLWRNTKARLWVHNLYFLVGTPSVESSTRSFIDSNGDSFTNPAESAPRLWMSNTTLQGSGTNNPALNLWATYPRFVYMEGAA